ncbi:YciI family protein [Brevibacillus sp. AY1]|uniref:YciI family protein n=1 Tax=Brevibacillus sp. AY1 TaxID=2807621 RepID=UPI0024580824|nr:YciI family protein [Brevibacillus sp. AY1]
MNGRLYSEPADFVHEGGNNNTSLNGKQEAKGLHPSSNGLRLSYPNPGEKPVVTDGPFTETKELIAGFILIDVKSREEAIEWAMRMPDPQGYGEGQIELRQVYEPELTKVRKSKTQPLFLKKEAVSLSNVLVYSVTLTDHPSLSSNTPY